MLSRLLPLATLVLLALPSTASAANLTFGPVPATESHVRGTVSFPITGAVGPATSADTWLEVDLDGPFAFVPGPIALPATLTFDTTQLPDGRHGFFVMSGDMDTSYFTEGSWTFEVDNTVPAAPVAIGPTQVTTDRSFALISWSRPRAEAAPAVITACSAQGCTDVAPRTLGGIARSQASVPLSVGANTVTVVLRDLAGNTSPATTWSITRTSPPPPPPPRPRVDPGLSITTAVARADGRTITVGGLLSVPHTNHVSVSVRARYGRRTRTVRTIAVTSGHGFGTELALPSARWRVATVIARVAGNSRYLTVEKRKQVRNPRRRVRRR